MTAPEIPARFDYLRPIQAVVREWTVPGAYHDTLRDRLREQWPDLAAALDRLAEYEQTPPDQRRPHRRNEPAPWQDGSS